MSSQQNRQDVNKKHHQRFYAVVKEDRVSSKGKKYKTRYSNNPPVEHHVGWIMDVREHRPRTASMRFNLKFPISAEVFVYCCTIDIFVNHFLIFLFSSSTGTSPSEGHLSSSVGSIPSFQHPSHALLKENNFTQQAYHKYHSRCLKG